MRFRGQRETFQVVTAFEYRHEPPFAELSGHVQQQRRELAKVGIGEHELPQRIVDARIETRGN